MFNNPLLYNDPSGELVWFIVAGAIIGGYISGVKANGTWNPFKWNWGETWGKIVLGGVVGAVSGAASVYVGGIAAVYASSAWGIQGGILGGAIAGFAGGAVGGLVSGLGESIIHGESIGRGIVRGVLTGAIGGAVLGGIAGGVQQGVTNAKVTSTGIGNKGNIWSGNPVAKGRSVWAVNNTPKPPSIGKKLEVGELTLNKGGSGTLKVNNYGDIKVTPKPNEIIQSVSEYKISDKSYIGELKLSSSDYEILFHGYTHRSTPVISTNGTTYPFSIQGYRGAFYTSTSGGEPTIQIINNVTKHKYKIRLILQSQ